MRRKDDIYELGSGKVHSYGLLPDQFTHRMLDD